MSKFDEIRDWIYDTPKRKAIAFFIAYVPFLLLLQLVMDSDDLIVDPLKEIGFVVGFGIFGIFLIYAIETRRERGQTIPGVTSMPYFTLLATAVKATIVLIVIISVEILITFRIENWGGDPNRTEQIVMQLVGVAFLAPLSALYVRSGWKFDKSGSLLWLLLCGAGAFGLYLWNSNYAWHTLSTNPSITYNRLYWLLCRVPFIPPGMMLIPWIAWLPMIWPKARQTDESR